jgi:hypothetical protein
VSITIFIVVGFFLTGKIGLEHWLGTAIISSIGMFWIYPFIFGHVMYSPYIGTALLVGTHSVIRLLLFLIGLAIYLAGVFL